MKIFAIVIGVLILVLFVVGIVHAIDLVKQRKCAKKESEKLQARQKPMVFHKHRSVGFTGSNSQATVDQNPLNTAVIIASSDSGYSGCSSSSSSSSCSSSSDSSSCSSSCD